jgi:hypothetical protein
MLKPPNWKSRQSLSTKRRRRSVRRRVGRSVGAGCLSEKVLRRREAGNSGSAALCRELYRKRKVKEEEFEEAHDKA